MSYFIPDKMKDAIIAKLANQAADYFGDAFKQCQYKDTLPKVSYCFCTYLVILHVEILRRFCIEEKRWKLCFIKKKLEVLGEAFEEYVGRNNFLFKKHEKFFCI